MTGALNTMEDTVSLRFLALLVAIYSFAVLVLFHDTAWSVVSTWQRSGTYAHGYLIIPIALWLAWDRRRIIAKMTPEPSRLALLFLIPVGFVWMLAYLVDVLVIQQLALVSIIVVGIWAIVGGAIAAVLVFSLGYLFFGVPMGEDLVPPMMELTATATVWMIQATGIPVYREGLFFSLPSGNWSVIEACSGIRYLIASVTLGVLYAYLTYRSRVKRSLFIVAAFVVPVLANIVRAYFIVLLGHLSGMKIATGVDHLVYGWIFFGFVMLLLFWLGSFWQDGPEKDKVSLDIPTSARNTKSSRPKLIVTMVVSISIAAIWPLMLLAIKQAPVQYPQAELQVPATIGAWESLAEKQWSWGPINPGADNEATQFYRNGEHVVALYMQQFLRQEQGVEMVSNNSLFIGIQPPWRVISTQQLTVQLGASERQLNQLGLDGPNERLYVWSWYRIGDFYTANRYLAKMSEGVQKLTFSRRGAARIALAVAAANDDEAARVLQSFLDIYMSEIAASLETAAKTNTQ